VRHTCAGANIVVFYKTRGKLATRGYPFHEQLLSLAGDLPGAHRAAIKGLDAELTTLDLLKGDHSPLTQPWMRIP